jgi:hypothetical protein
MEIINQEENPPKVPEKKTWHKPKLYWGKEIGFMSLIQNSSSSYLTPNGTPMS